MPAILAIGAVLLLCLPLVLLFFLQWFDPPK
jgi:hypothetical protein